MYFMVSTRPAVNSVPLPTTMRIWLSIYHRALVGYSTFRGMKNCRSLYRSCRVPRRDTSSCRVRCRCSFRLQSVYQKNMPFHSFSISMASSYRKRKFYMDYTIARTFYQTDILIKNAWE